MSLLSEVASALVQVEQNTSATIQSVWGYVLPTIFASIGGGLSYKNKVDKHYITFTWIGLIGEFVSAAFIGLVVLLIAKASGISPEMSGALAGLSGHMGVRTLFLLELIFIKKAEQVTGFNLKELEKEDKNESR